MDHECVECGYAWMDNHVAHGCPKCGGRATNNFDEPNDDRDPPDDDCDEPLSGDDDE